MYVCTYVCMYVCTYVCMYVLLYVHQLVGGGVAATVVNDSFGSLRPHTLVAEGLMYQ